MTKAVTTAQLKRAIKAASDCNLVVHGCIMTAEEVRLVFHPLDEKAKSGHSKGPKPWPEISKNENQI